MPFPVGQLASYHIAGNFGQVFNLVIWQIFQKLFNLKLADLISACVPMMLGIQIAKF